VRIHIPDGCVTPVIARLLNSPPVWSLALPLTWLRAKAICLSAPVPCENVSERILKCRALPDAAVDKIREFRVIQRN
jgi:hypothetical protein